MRAHKLIIPVIVFVFATLVFFVSRDKPAAPTPESANPAVDLEIPGASAIPRAMAGSSPQKAPPGNVLLQPQSKWRETPVNTSFSRFVEWTDQYVAAPVDRKSALLPEGVALAKERREDLRAMIEADPERALALAIPLGVRRGLPGQITAQLEERISARGNLDVLAAIPEPGKTVTPVFRRAYINDREFEAFVYGRRRAGGARENIPLHGIAVDELFAVNENPVRILEPEEAADAKQAKLGVEDPVCGVSQLPADSKGEETVVAVGEEIQFLCQASHVSALNEQLIQAETVDYSSVEASAYTEGQKRVIFIRVDFSDLAGVPFSDVTGTNLISSVNAFYRDCSYNKTSFTLAGQGSDLTPTFRMPRTAEYYGTNGFYNALRTDARAAASAAGYVLDNYEFDVICMGNVPGWTWGGLGRVGAPGSWLRNNFSVGVATHELGHNFGLNHANFWDTSGASVIGPGFSYEYGDHFDTMGLATAGINHFNARYKQYLNWLAVTDFAVGNSNGTYRIYAHDDINSFGVRALKIPKPNGTNYWVEFRQKFTSNKWLMNGAGLRWAENFNESSLLLDTTPGSPDGKTDSAIVIGRTYSDLDAGVHITPIGKGGTTPESLDVVVYRGVFPTNVPPTVTLSAPVTDAAVGAPLAFSAAASDENGDALAYYWDFGDSNFGTNGPSASKSWSSAGEYIVRCTVTDMRGGTASDSVIVRVGSPTTYRISGRVTYGTNGANGVRVYVSSTRMAYTDSDGTYTITGLPAGTYTVSASWYGYSFTRSFSNPVSVGPNAANIDFTMTANSPVILAQPQSQTVYQGSTLDLSVTASGPELNYQWFFNASPIAAATTSSYSKENVGTNDAGNYTVQISNPGGQLLSAAATVTVAFDTQNPTLTVFAPKSGFAYTSATSELLIDGNASDDVRVVGVEYDLNNAGFAPALLAPGFWTYWHSYINMAPGTNVLRIRSVDIAGNYSPVTTRTFYWHAPSTLTLTINGLGELTAISSTIGTPTNGAALLVGRSYSFTAKGGTNWILTNVTYTADGGEAGTVFVNTTALPKPKVTFTMKSNMVVQANFITNPLVRIAGTYNGLFHEADAVRHHSAGYATIKITSQYAASGKMLLDGNSVSFSGKLNIDGTLSKTVSRAKVNKPDLALALELNSDHTLSGTITGNSLSGTPFTSALAADRWVWTTNAGQQALQFTNRYTMVITGKTSNADGPYGHGYATIDLTSVKGQIRFAGQLSESYRKNVKLIQGTTVSTNGAWPLFAPLYYTTNRLVTNGLSVKPSTEFQGELMGWVHFVANTGAGTTNLAPLGTLDWIKTGWTNASWPAGFTNQLQAISSRHIPPVARSTNRIYLFTNAWVTLDGGQLAAAVSNLVNLKTNNTFFVNVKDTNNPVTHNFRAALSSKLGFISGTFTNGTASGSTNIPWEGVMLQDHNRGLGFFVDHPAATNSSGRVILMPAN